jgi:glucarate dehydratase
MKKGPSIRDIRITPVAVADPPVLNAAGLHAPYALRIVLEVITSDGITGISEIPGSRRILQALERLTPHIIGCDPFEWHTLRLRITSVLGKDVQADRGDRPWDQRVVIHIFSALEVACMDIVGKVTERSIASLLGGARREQVPFSAYLFYKYEGAGGPLGFGIDPKAAPGWPTSRQEAALDPEGIVRQAEAMVQAFGFKSIKLKGGVYPPDIERDTLIALAKAFPDLPLRFDPNAVWSLETARTYGPQLQPYLEYLEDPVRTQSAMAALRSELDLPLATNMCTTSFEDLPDSIVLGSEDIILCDHHFWGGMRATMDLATLCSVFQRKLSMHSNNHLGISFAAMIHLGAALPEFSYALDTHYPWQHEEVIVGGRIPLVEGMAELPSGPGLGVEIDRDALDRLHQQYLQCGLEERDDQAMMQTVQPDWVFKATRW